MVFTKKERVPLLYSDVRFCNAVSHSSAESKKYTEDSNDLAQ